jgi:hypothetical protein
MLPVKRETTRASRVDHAAASRRDRAPRRDKEITRVKKKILASRSRSSTIRRGEKKSGEAMAVTSPVNGKT